MRALRSTAVALALMIGGRAGVLGAPVAAAAGSCAPGAAV
jgi:hypothetical protein